jgi:diguanylate cyclase (GGDEF)-like protein
MNTSDKDQLTGVFSRRVLAAHVAQNMAALFVDIDGLIWVNDQAGCLAGDQALAQVAGALSRMFPANVFRVGGDEFLVLLGGRSAVEARKAGEAVVDSVRKLNIAYGRVDRPERERLEVNVVVFTLEPEVARRNFAGEHAAYVLGDELSALIYPEKLRTGRGHGLVVDTLAAPSGVDAPIPGARS